MLQNLTNGVIPETLVMTFNHSIQAEEAGDCTQAGEEAGQRYYHISTPLKKRCCVMYRYDVRGYSYGEGKPIDITYVGYPYTDDTLNQASVFNRNQAIMNLEMEQYFRGDTLCLKFGPIKRYCNSFQLYYSGHYQNPSLGLNQNEYKVYVTKSQNNLV